MSDVYVYASIHHPKDQAMGHGTMRCSHSSCLDDVANMSAVLRRGARIDLIIVDYSVTPERRFEWRGTAEGRLTEASRQRRAAYWADFDRRHETRTNAARPKEEKRG